MRVRKKWGDCLGSWGRAKKAGEGGKRGETVSVVGASEKSGRARKKMGETVSEVGASEKSGRESEESTCDKSFLVLESYTYSYPGCDTV